MSDLDDLLVRPEDMAALGFRPPTWTTYDCPDGWEFGWVSDPDYFTDADEPVTVVRRRWVLVERTEVTWHPTTELCRTCGGDGDLVAADGETLMPCGRCDGDGGDPDAGSWTETP